MFTIRQYHPSGNEFLWAARTITSERFPVPDPAPQHQTGIVTAELPDGQMLILGEGTVYVMNDGGKTVAKFDLGCWSLPSDEGDPDLTPQAA